MTYLYLYCRQEQPEEPVVFIKVKGYEADKTTLVDNFKVEIESNSPADNTKVTDTVESTTGSACVKMTLSEMENLQWSIVTGKIWLLVKLLDFNLFSV